MKSNQHKKGALWGLTFIIAVFGIAFMLILFYVWVKDNVEGGAQQQAETIAAEVELRILFSDLIRNHGTAIANEDEDKVEEVIEKYAENYASIQQGGYDAVCDTEGIDRECTLEITVYQAASTIWIASFFTAAAPYTLPAYILMKMLSLDIIQETSQDAYLPTKDGRAMNFKLITTVEAA